MGIIKGLLKIGLAAGAVFAATKIVDRYKANNPDGVETADEKITEFKKAAREVSMSQTRIYTGFGSGMEETPEEKKKPARKLRPVKKTFVFSIADDRKFRRLKILAAVFVLILAFEICFAVMQYKSANLPGKTAELKSQTEAMLEENKELKSESENLGNYEEIKELRDSWERLKEQLEE